MLVFEMRPFLQFLRTWLLDYFTICSSETLHNNIKGIQQQKLNRHSIPLEATLCALLILHLQ